MAAKIVVVDLGLGNLRSVARALERAGASATISADHKVIRQAPRIVVPGQGAFRDCASALARGFDEVLHEFIASGRPYLGICLGMQLLFERSAEAPSAKGLGLFAGSVERFSGEMRDEASGERLKVPHMGWNQVMGQHPWLAEGGWYYFVHSYYCVPAAAELSVGRVHYGDDFCAVVARDNVFACQFHPEKSQEDGHVLLSRFVEST